MKKLYVLILLFVPICISVFQPVASESEVSLQTLENHYLEMVDFSYVDLELTDEEMNAVVKYQTEELRFGLYMVDGYYQEYDGVILGNNYHITKQLEKVFNLNTSTDVNQMNVILDNYQNGDYDIVPGLVNTEERTDTMYFSDFIDEPDVYLYSNDYISVKHMSDLDGKVIAKQAGMRIILEEYIQYLSSIGIEVTIVEFSNIFDAVPLLGDSVDYIVNSKNIDLIKAGTNFIDAKSLFSTYDIKVTSRKTNDLKNLLSAFDKAYEYGLKENLVSYRQTLSYLLFESGVYFTDEELQFIEETKTNPIKVGSASNWIPYLYTNDDGDLSGYAYDTFFTLTDNLGIEYDFTFSEDNTWNQVLNDIGKDSNPIIYDTIIADSVTNYTDDFIKYSIPIRTEEAYVVGLTSQPLINSVFDLRNYTVGVIPFYAATTYLEENIGLNDFKVYQTLEEITNALKEGEIDYFVVVKSEYEGMYYMEEEYSIVPKYTIKDDFKIAVAFPTNGEDTDILLSLYNKAIVLSDRSDVSNEHFNLQVDLSTVVLKQTIIVVSIAIFALIMGVTLVGLYYIKRIRRMLLVDVLTGIKNRRALFTDTNIHSFEYLYYLDMDFFKLVNDEFGHKVGDEILIDFCKIIKNNIEGTLYRLGGDEFILLSTIKYQKSDFDIPVIVSENIDKEIKLTLSIGALQVSDFNTAGIDELITLADIAMYEVKQSGKNEMKFLTKDMIEKHSTGDISYKSRKENRE